MTLIHCGSQVKIEDIRGRLASADKSPRQLIEQVTYRHAAVLLPLACYKDNWCLLFTRRSDEVQDHKGQVSFPGGAIEKLDNSPVEAALRETFEEVGIRSEDVQLLGTLRDFPTITGYIISPIVGVIPWPYPLTLAEGEVSRAFLIPIDWMADPAHQEEVEMTFPNGWREKVIHFNLYDNEKVWGVTARITVEFLNALGIMGGLYK